MIIQEFLGQLRRYKCQRLPQYIILHFKRFTKNVFVEEKNPTIVTFPLRGLDFRDCAYACIEPFLIGSRPRSLFGQIWMLRLLTHQQFTISSRT
jgi:hypothetical protein